MCVHAAFPPTGWTEKARFGGLSCDTTTGRRPGTITLPPLSITLRPPTATKHKNPHFGMRY